MSMQPLASAISLPGQGANNTTTHAVGTTQGQAAKDKKLREACVGFESIFIQKMWEQMRNTLPKDGFMHSREEQTWQSMYDQELAKTMSSAGGIGLADMMYEQLSRNLLAVSASTAGIVRSKGSSFTVKSAPLLPVQATSPLPTQQLQPPRESAQASQIYNEPPLPEQDTVDSAAVDTALRTLRAEQAARPTTVTMPTATAQAHQPAVQTALQATLQQGSIAPLRANNAQGIAQPSPSPVQATAQNLLQQGPATPLGTSSIQGAAQPFTSTLPNNTVQAAMPANAQTNIQPITGASPSPVMVQTETPTPATQHASPRVTRTRRTTNIPSRGALGRNNARTPLARQGGVPPQAAVQSVSGDIRTLNLQGESLNLTSSAAQHLLAQQILETQQAQGVIPSTLQAGKGSMSITQPQLLPQGMPGALTPQTTLSNGTADAISMHSNALRQSEQIQQVQQAMFGSIAPLRPHNL